MSKKIFETSFNLERLKETGTLFPGEIEGDPWVMYHGTSASNAESIESNGFIWKSRVAQEELLRIASVYEAMNWCGTDSDGYNVLKSYSINYDYVEQNKSYTYFAETSRRALLYATKDFAGGEKLRSIRRAIQELKEYLENQELRNYHFEYMQNEYNQLRSMNALNAEEARPVKVDLDWLSHKVSELHDLYLLSVNARESHRQGVVYAVKISSADLKHFSLNPRMGIQTQQALPPINIIAIMTIPEDCASYLSFRDDNDLERLMSLKEGLYAELSKRSV